MDTAPEEFIEPVVEEQQTAEENNQVEEHEEETGAAAVEKRWPGWPGHSVFRILIPSQKVGAVIGRKGEFIKKMCEESKARIKILDAPPGAPERAVLSVDLRQISH